MARRLVRAAAIAMVVTWAVWEITSEAPLVPLLVALVGSWVLAIDVFTAMPNDVRELKARQAAWARRPRSGPRVPWGLDPICAPAGVAIGLVTTWWIGVLAWGLITAIVWLGWIKTRPSAQSGSQLSRRASFVVGFVVYAFIAAAVAVMFIEAASRWGEAGLLSVALGFGAWLLLIEHLSRRQERRHGIA